MRVKLERVSENAVESQGTKPIPKSDIIGTCVIVSRFSYCPTEAPALFIFVSALSVQSRFSVDVCQIKQTVQET